MQAVDVTNKVAVNRKREVIRGAGEKKIMFIVVAKEDIWRLAWQRNQ